MKKLLLSIFAVAMLSVSTLSAYDESEFYYTPKRYTTSYLFAFEMGGKHTSNYDMSFYGGMSSRYIAFFGQSDFNWGFKGQLDYSQIENDDIEDRIDVITLDLGPTIAWNPSRKSNLYISAGLSSEYLFNDDHSSFFGTPFGATGLEYFMNDDIVLALEYKFKEFDKDNSFRLDTNQDQFTFSLKMTYR